MSIANRLSRQFGVLSHYLRTSEPVSAEKEPLLLKYKVRQYDRYQQEVSNAKVPFGILVETSALTTEQKKTLTQIYSKQNWSNRVQIKIIRLARTISDLAGEERIAEQVIWEAMTLRRRGQNKQMTIAREK